MAPAWIAAQAEPADALKSGARTTTGGASLLQRGLVELQAALSLVLLVAAGLFSLNLNKLQSTDLKLETKKTVCRYQSVCDRKRGAGDRSGPDFRYSFDHMTAKVAIRHAPSFAFVQAKLDASSVLPVPIRTQFRMWSILNGSLWSDAADKKQFSTGQRPPALGCPTSI
jgi:hypothetical protein